MILQTAAVRPASHTLRRRGGLFLSHRFLQRAFHVLHGHRAGDAVASQQEEGYAGHAVTLRLTLVQPPIIGIAVGVQHIAHLILV